MYKIKNFFDDNIINTYYNYILKKFQNKKVIPNDSEIKIDMYTKDFEVQFLPDIFPPSQKYKISFKTLLTGNLKEIMDVPGMDIYMHICRFHYCCVRENYSQLTFLKRLYYSYPNEIDKAYDHKSKMLTYTFLKTKDTCIIKNVKNSTAINFESVISFVQSTLTKKNPALYDNYKTKLNLSQNSMTFENLKEWLSLLFNDSKERLGAKIKGNNEKITNGYYINYKFISDEIHHELMRSLNIKTCPYCNRQYITSYTIHENNEDNVRVTSDLDHYYQQALFPLFSMSLFNFIPSCHVCNSLMKGDTYAETLYPYEDAAENDISFEITLKNDQETKNLVEIWLGKGTKSFPEMAKISEVTLHNLTKTKNKSLSPEELKYREKCINNEIEIFKLDELYKNHLDQALNVLLILRIYLEEDFYANNINQICQALDLKSVKNRSSIKKDDPDSVKMYSLITREEIRCFLLGFITDGQGEMDKPLAKLISDIYNSEVDKIENSKAK